MIAFRAFGKVYGRQVAVEGLTLDISARRGRRAARAQRLRQDHDLKAAAGLIHPTSGQRPARRAGAQLRRLLPRGRLLSFLPQRVSFPEVLTGREVVEFYRELRGLGDRARRRGPAVRVAQRGRRSRTVGTYSGGMVQRLGLAVAALPDAPVFLLDEPTAALDPEGLAAFYELVERHTREGGPCCSPRTSSATSNGWPIDSRSSSTAGWSPC